MKKRCSKCGQVKSLELFNKQKSSKDGLRWQCKECQREYSRSWRKENPGYDTEYRKNNLEKSRERSVNWCKNNPKKVQEKYIKYRKNNLNKIKERNIKWNKENPEKVKKSNAKWYKNNTEKARKDAIEYERERRKTDSIYKLRCDIRGLIRSSFKRKGWKKNGKTQKILGCPWGFFKQYIELQFTEGMTWENHGKGKGKWNYDHIIPLAIAKNEEELIKLNHWSNFQPLWYEDNMRKGAKII